jgi:hypothetical protein
VIVLFDTPQDHEEAAAEIGMEYGELLTPLTRRAWRGARFAIDNGAFSQFDAKGFVSLLRRQEPHRDKCIFVACPDVVGSAMRTRELFKHWAPKLEGWPLAYVAQNGQEFVEIPWDQCAAVFIGGDDRFKLGAEAVAIIKTAKAMGKWTHVGRCNTPERTEKFESLGVDSIDGTGIARYSWMRLGIRDGKGKLFEGSNP